ncbi:hypothetical protein CsSME_00015507 [Camellia sinensis var. sinensis]
MSIPFLPSFSPSHSLSLQRVLTFFLPPAAVEYWFATLLSQFNLHKFVSSIKENGSMQPSESLWLKTLGRHLCNRSLYALNFCSELLITPDDAMLLSIEVYGDNKTTQIPLLQLCEPLSLFHSEAEWEREIESVRSVIDGCGLRDLRH